MQTNDQTEGKAVVVQISDTHTNSSVALCPPVINLDDGGTYHCSRSQHELYEAWKDIWTVLDRDYNRKEWRRIVVLGGDLAELDTKRRSIQLISPNKATIENMVIETLEPAVDWSDKAIFIRGTPAHTGKSSWIEEKVASDTSTAVWASKERASWDHLRTSIDRVRFDILHTGRLAPRKWGRYASAIRLAEDIAWDYLVERKEPAPHVVLRSHNHRIAHAEVDDLEVWFSPAWSIKTEYAYQVGFENKVSDIGAVVIECENGNKKSRVIKYPLKGDQRVWRMKL